MKVLAGPSRRATARGRMRVIRKRARVILTRAREAKIFSIFFAAGASNRRLGACRPRTRETGPWRSAAVRENRWTSTFTQVRGHDYFARIDSSPARSDAGGASKGVIAMAQDAIFVLAAIATIVGAAAAVGSLALSVALLLPRGKTRADDQEGKKNGR